MQNTLFKDPGSRNMISQSHRFTFIHLPKTGGCSIEKALAAECSLKTAPLLRKKKFTINYQHATLPEVINFHAEASSFFSFCFVRNPWDRLVSFYSHISQRKGAWKNQRIPPCMFSFKDMIQDLYLKKFNPSFIHCPYAFIGPCHKWITDISLVCKFERIESDFNIVCKTLKLPPRPLPILNKSSHEPYQSYYTDTSLNMVADMYRQDIEAFGYDFN